MTTPVDDLPIEVRRRNWGWFGDPWPSFICYDEDGRLLEEMRQPFPEGESCLYCEQPFMPGDSGQAMPHAGRLKIDVRHVHKECLLRTVTGTISCMKGEHEHDTGKTYRQEALEVWKWVGEHGFPAASSEVIGGTCEPANDQGRP